MGIKDLFDSENTKILTSTTLEEEHKAIESIENLKQKRISKERFIPQIDFSKPGNFAHYGSAERYYENSMKRVLTQYPYDGSESEIQEFLNNSTYVDLYVFENKYPRTNGYIKMSATGWGTLTGSGLQGGWGSPSITASIGQEYIDVRGGPHTASGGMIGQDLVDVFAKSNIYDADIYDTNGVLSLNRSGSRESNLQFDLSSSGITIEFWMKKENYHTTLTQKEVIFDLWNQKAIGTPQYGRLLIFMSGAEDGGSMFRYQINSGSTISAFYAAAGSLTLGPGGSEGSTSSVNSDWHHHAFSFKQDGGSLTTKTYLDASLRENAVNSVVMNDMTGSWILRIGALQERPEAITPTANMAGYGKLSASLDEFRFWKTVRTEKQIADSRWHQIRGGTNTDISNTDLGVYLKFNEGITTKDYIDSVVLDYSGRISNGVWTGYPGSAARNTGSAMVESGIATSEYLDPIIYDEHPDYQSILTSLKDSGSVHDNQNTSLFTDLLPSWIIDEDIEEGSGHLHNLTQILSSYFDTLHMQIESLPKIKNVNYTTASIKPLPFADRLLESQGFVTPEIFIDSTITEYYLNRDDEHEFEIPLTDIKNHIYKNIYNNLIHLYKSKGTEKAYRNLLRCYGVDDEIVKFNTYANNQTLKIENTHYISPVRKRYIDFNAPNRYGAVILNASASVLGVTHVATPKQIDPGLAITDEIAVIFPHNPDTYENNRVFKNFLTSSLFGYHIARTGSSNYEWTGSAKDNNFELYAVRPEKNSNDAYFWLTDRNRSFDLTSSLYSDIYTGEHWNFAIRNRTDQHPVGLQISGNLTGHTWEFVGYNVDNGIVKNSFKLSSSFDSIHRGLAAYSRIYYAGAHRVNFTGSLSASCDVKISSVRSWHSYLSDDALLAHAKDPFNMGTDRPTRNTQLLNPSLTTAEIPQINTIRFAWEMDGVTTSDNNGEFRILDASSGSNRFSDQMPGVFTNLLTQHEARGYLFPTSSTSVVQFEHINSARQRLPEVVDSSDMINVLTQDEEIFTRDAAVSQHIFAFEKSMYGIISQEILNIFAGATHMNDLIGDVTNKYRSDYKDMRILREIFFEKLGNTPDLDKFFEYYRWIDSSIMKFLEQLTPGSAIVSDNIRNMIESHILERNSYDHKYPQLDYRGNTRWAETKIEGIVQARGEQSYNWKFGHAPVDNNDADNALWWKTRAIANDTVLSSGDTTKDVQRQRLRAALNDDSFASPIKLRKADKTKYRSSLNSLREFRQVMKLDVDKSRTVIGGGINFEGNKKFGIFKDLIMNYGTGLNDSGFELDIVHIADKNVNDIKDPSKKVRKKWGVESYFDKVSTTVSGGANQFYFDNAEKLIPGSLVSSSVRSGYNANDNNSYNRSTLNATALTNIHFDAYGADLETPMQGPFSNAHVGGLQHRHVKMNRGSDTLYTRPEAWRVRSFPTDSMLRYKNPQVNPMNDVEDPAYPIAIYYRDETAKRPVVIKNVKYTTGSAILGNYRREIELVPVTGRRMANKSFVQSEGFTATGVSSSFVTDLVDYTKPVRTTNSGTIYPGKNASYAQHVIVQRFSAPGSPETMGDHQGGDGLDVESGEYSPYNNLNFRNLTVRQPLNRTLLVHHTRQFGFYSGSSVSSLNFAGTASFHKNHRNRGLRLEYSLATSPLDATIVTGAVFDNAFVSSLIPRSDLQYAWVTGSYESARQLGFASPNGLVSSSTGFLPAIAFSSGSKAGVGQVAGGQKRYGLFDGSQPILTSDFVFVDYVGMNTCIQETIDTGSYDFVGYTGSGGELDSDGVYRYVNRAFADEITGPAGNPYVLNGLLAHRAGVYAHANFKTIDHSKHPIVRRQRKDNIITHTAVGGDERIMSSETIKDKNGKTKVFTEPVLNNKYKPVKIEMTVIAGQNKRGHPKTKKMVAFVSHVGQNLFFENPELNNILGIKGRKKTPYDSIKKMYLNGGLDDPSSPIVDVNKVIYTETVFPSGKYSHLNKTRGRNNFNNNFWREVRQRRSGHAATHKPKFSLGNVAASQSAWPLDAIENFTTQHQLGANTAFNVGYRAGELVNNKYFDPSFFITPTGDASGLVATPLYSRPHKIYYKHTMVPQWSPVWEEIVNSIAGFPSSAFTTGAAASGQAYWEANRLAGRYVSGTFTIEPRSPFYDKYDEFIQDARAKGKGYGVIPEYRISEHIDTYYKNGGGDILQENPGEFTIFGSPTASTTPQNSSEADFFDIYTNSDFMKYFELVKRDHDELLIPGTLSIKCKAIKKFIPYNGFYPVLRTLDLATQFSKSYGQYLQYAGAESQYDDLKMRPVLQPLFSPGIMYNTIKSGLAVDYPVLTGSFRKSYTDQARNNGYHSMVANIGSNSRDRSAPVANSNHIDGWDYRVPFEAILNPENYIANKWLVDSEAMSSSFDLSASLGLGGDNLYTMMANNFLAESVEFFLDRKKVTKIVSDKQEDFKSVTPGQPYGMRIKLWRSMNGPKPSTGSWGEWPLPQNSGSAIKENFTMYSRPSAFGPPVAATGSDTNGQAAQWGTWPSGTFGCENGVYASHTPPYYDGEAWIDLIYFPWSTNAGTDAQYDPELNTPYKPTLEEILTFVNPTASADNASGFPGGTYVRKWRYDREVLSGSGGPGVSSPDIYAVNAPHVGPMGGHSANKWAMQADASILFNEVEDEKWVVKTKFETPMLNFAYVTASNNLKTIAPSTTTNFAAINATSPNGMWHQFGRLPQEGEGVFLQITDIPQNWLENHPSATILFDPDGQYTGVNIAGIDSEATKYRVPLGANLSQPPLSLVDICGFSTTAKMVGKIAETRKVSEAIVAIPFIQEESTRKFFEIDIERPAPSVSDQVKKMQKFIIPPRFDFIHNEGIDPFAMYIFEFAHKFSKDDLSHMWQNLMPQVGTKMELVSSIISHELVEGELMAEVPKNLQWMVFKVKQRGAVDYWTTTQRRTERTMPFYSYNWPYDFFSLIELVQMDTEVELKKEEAIKDPTRRSGIDLEDVRARDLRAILTDEQLDDFALELDIPSDTLNLTDEQEDILEEVLEDILEDIADLPIITVDQDAAADNTRAPEPDDFDLSGDFLDQFDEI